MTMAPPVVPGGRRVPIPWSPLCMDRLEYAAWQQANAEIHGRDRAERPCEDCPAAFAREMRLEGRCNGEPGRPAPPMAEGPRRRHQRWLPRQLGTPLTDGEARVYAVRAACRTDAEAAAQLGLSVWTVRDHLRKIRQRQGWRRTLQAPST